MHELLLIKGSYPTPLHTAVLNLQGSRGVPAGCSFIGCMRCGGFWAGPCGMEEVKGCRGSGLTPCLLLEGPGHRGTQPSAQAAALLREAGITAEEQPLASR